MTLGSTIQIAYWTAGIVYSMVATVAAIGALLVYRNNSKRERPRWAEGLYARFYEKRGVEESARSTGLRGGRCGGRELGL
jgi:hypothetical protein